MRPSTTAALCFAAALMAGCGRTVTHETADDSAVCSAYRAERSQVEVIAQGRVLRVLGVAAGRESPHEGFLLRLASSCDLVVRVEANTDFTGSVPLRIGDAVTVKGEYEFYPRGGVIHWTHRDPRGRHADGYVEVGDHFYD